MTRPVKYRGVGVRQFDVLCTPDVWTHDETHGHGTADTLEQARAQINAHLAKQEAT